MRKKKSQTTPHILWFKILLVGLLALLILLVWVGRSKDAASQLTHLFSSPAIAENQDTIRQIISPILYHDDDFVLTFEDELPDPVPQTKHTNESENEPISKNIDKRHVLALIIDDIGYDFNALRRLLALPFTFTVSILPDSPHAAEAARMAYQHGIPVMLHMPMQTSNPKYQQKMERFYLHDGMSKQAFTQVFESALAKVPHVVGINNHMGSRLTAHHKSMQWLAELCKKHDLFFVDSRTSSTSVAAKYAKEAGVAWNARDIFLDHSLNKEKLKHAWSSALSCIKRNDHCVMLAHPHPETLNFLETQMQGLSTQSFVPITQLLK